MSGRHQLEDQRIAQNDIGVRLHDSRPLDAKPDDRQGHDQPGPGSGNADVKQLTPVGARAFHANDGPHRTCEQKRNGNEERQAGRHPVAERLDKVSHLVREQNPNHGPGIDQPLPPVLGNLLADGVVDDVGAGVPIERPGNERRKAGGDKQKYRQKNPPRAVLGDVSGHQLPLHEFRSAGPVAGRLGRLPGGNLGSQFRRGRRPLRFFPSFVVHPSSIAAR